MIKVGITGSMGSGKSTVCNLFEILGVPVYDADEHAKEIIQTDPKLIAAIKKLLGDDVYFPDGKLDRKKIAGIVFNNKKLLEAYDQLIHPVVIRDANAWMQQFSDHPYILKEAALLFESGAIQFLDKIICVTAPEKLRLQRIMQRDYIPEEVAKTRMKNQWSEEEKVKRSDYIINNDGNHLLIPQVMIIHEELLKFGQPDSSEKK